MKKFWNFIILLIVAILVIPVFLPSKKHFEKSIVVNQSLEKSFNTVAELNNWHNWFEAIEQNSCCKMNVVKATDTTKARINYWTAKHGNESLVLKKEVKDSLLAFKIKFHHHKACLKWFFQPQGDSTQVTINFDFNLSYPIGRFFGIFMNEKLMGFIETTMLSYKTFVESIPRKVPKMKKKVNFEEITMEPKPALSVAVSTDVTHLSKEMEKAYGQIMSYIKANGIAVTGAPYTLYEKWNPPTEVTCIAAVPVNKKVTGNANIKMTETPSGKMLKVVYFGAYDKTGYIYNAYDKYAASNKLETRDGPWEEYITDPTMEADTTKWQTNIYFQIK